MIGIYLIIISSIMNIISLAGQGVTLPLFVDSFDNGDHHANPYFVLLFASFSFTIFFLMLATYRSCRYKSPLMGSFQIHKEFIKIGILNAINGILIVYSSPANRTPVDIQNILVQSVLPYTFISSYFVKSERPTRVHIFGVSIVAFGILISLVPVFLSLGNIGQFTYYNIIWSTIFLLGNLPAALCNVYQDRTLKLYKNYIEIIQLLAWSSLYQLFVMMVVFWTGYLPGFGFSNSLSQFISEMSYSFSCYFGKCASTGFIGLIFISFYIITYITTGILVKYKSANFTTLLSSISVSFAITFWLVFPKLNNRTISLLEIISDYLSAIIVCIGIWIYTREKDNKNGYTRIDSTYKLQNDKYEINRV